MLIGFATTSPVMLIAGIMFVGMVAAVVAIVVLLAKIANKDTQQRQINDLKRELEEMKQKE